MGVKSILAKPYAKLVSKSNKKWIKKPIDAQNRIFKSLIKSAQNTAFGKDHRFEEIKSYEDFKESVPIVDYEKIKSYIERIQKGEENVLWPENPLYFCKTSGTTSGIKYIPISRESMPFHIKCAKDAILSYIAETGNTNALKGGNIFIQGSPELDETNLIPVGRLSGIVAHYVPWYLQSSNFPSFETNCIEDWEEKLDAIIEETLCQNMTLISGIPPWVQMYFERIVAKTGKQILEVFPKFSLLIFGGVSFEPYRKSFRQLIGKNIPSIEIYPSSEGFIAYQDTQTEEGMLLCTNHGIFYEFIPLEEYFDKKPKRLSLKDVKTGVDYALILNTNAGLWGYSIGDTIRFVSTNPYRLVVSGRIRHFTSAFGEHVIGKEVENALQITLEKHPAEINEFHVAPQVSPEKGLPFHEWFIEFKKEPKSLGDFVAFLDENMQSQNTYYKDLIDGKVLRPLIFSKIKKGGFIKYMKSVGKLGGQNKVPRLANNRDIADKLREFYE
tara:strand:- start:1484 stop:2977 length:1494 start_codon:yes stop_codon:yes gene_type:complete